MLRELFHLHTAAAAAAADAATIYKISVSTVTVSRLSILRVFLYSGCCVVVVGSRSSLIADRLLCGWVDAQPGRSTVVLTGAAAVAAAGRELVVKAFFVFLLLALVAVGSVTGIRWRRLR